MFMSSISSGAQYTFRYDFTDIPGFKSASAYLTWAFRGGQFQLERTNNAAQHQSFLECCCASHTDRIWLTSRVWRKWLAQHHILHRRLHRPRECLGGIKVLLPMLRMQHLRWICLHDSIHWEKLLPRILLTLRLKSNEGSSKETRRPVVIAIVFLTGSALPGRTKLLSGRWKDPSQVTVMSLSQIPKMQNCQSHFLLLPSCLSLLGSSFNMGQVTKRSFVRLFGSFRLYPCFTSPMCD